MDQLIYPDAGRWIDALQAGQQAGMTQRRNNAVRQAGGLMASGDYAGAAKAVYGEGDFSGGAAIAKYGQEQVATARQSKFAEALGSGDYATAGQLAAADPTLHKLFTERLAEDADTMATYAQTLKGMTPEDALTHYQQEILPALHQRGLRGPQYDAWVPTPQNIAQVETAALGLKEKLGLTRQAAVDAETVRHNKATEDGYIAVPEGGKLVPRHPGGGAPDSAAAPAAPADGAGPPSGFDAVYHGFVAPHEGGYTAHDGNGAPANFGINEKANPEVDVSKLTPQAAQQILHDKYWVPSGAEKLPPALQAIQFDTAVNMGVGAAQSLLQQSGGDPAAYLKLREDRYRAIAAADPSKAAKLPVWLARNADLAHYVAGGSASAATPAPAHAGDPAGTIYGDAKPVQWKSDGKGNLINEVTGDRKIDVTASADIVANPDTVKAIIDGRAPMPTSNRAATDPKWQAAMAEAMRQDPTLDAANYLTRVRTRADFATGTAAKAKTALNTALGHAGDLYGQIDALNNTGIQPVNMVGNAIAGSVSDQRRAEINTFNLTKEALMHEAMKVFSGSQGSMMEFKQLADTLDVNDGPKSQHAVLKKLIGLLASKMDALGEQYKTGMGRDLEASQIMSPHAQNVFNKIAGIPSEKVAEPGAPSTPTSGALPPQAVAQLKAGHDTTFGNGQVWTLRNGQPARVK